MEACSEQSNVAKIIPRRKNSSTTTLAYYICNQVKLFLKQSQTQAVFLFVLVCVVLFLNKKSKIAILIWFQVWKLLRYSLQEQQWLKTYFTTIV